MNEKEKALDVLRALSEAGYTLEDLIKAINMDCEADGAEQKVKNEKETNLTARITRLFLQMGMPTNIKGYRYCIKAVEKAYKDRKYVESITKELYQEIAKEMQTTNSRVERAMRHAVECVWNHGEGMDIIEEVFGNTVSSMRGKPTNSQFVATVAEYLKLQDLP